MGKQTEMFPSPTAAARAVEPTAPEPADGPPLSREQRRSRRHRNVRATTFSVKRMTKRELALGRLEYPESEDLPARPTTREGCAGVPRPCPFVSCRHHLYLDVSARTGNIKMNFPDIEPDELPADASCALDVAERSGTTLEAVGTIMNLTRERIRQVEVRALAKLHAAHEMVGLRDFYGDGPTLSKRRLPILEEADDGL